MSRRSEYDSGYKGSSTAGRGKSKKQSTIEEEDTWEDDPLPTLPGQKYPPPPDGDGTRIFYETLYNQQPDSKMAQKWMIEHGLLSQEQLNRILRD